MPSFPHGSSWPIAAYTFSIEGAQLRTGSPADIRRAYDGSKRLPRVPTVEHWNSTMREHHGWGGFSVDDRDDEVVLSEPLVILSYRSFIKRVPSSTLREMVDERCRAWMRERGVQRAPTAVRKEIRESVEDSLITDVPPTIRNIGVIIDLERQMFLILANGKGASGISVSVSRFLRDVYDCGRVDIARVDAMFDLNSVFPGVPFPQDTDAMFMRYILTHALNSDTLVMEGLPPFRLSLGESAEVVNGLTHGAVKVRGLHESIDLMESQVRDDDEDEAPPHAVRRVMLDLHDELGEWSFLIGPTGQLLRAQMPGLASCASIVDDMHARSLMCFRAVDMMRAITHAFALGHLTQALDTQPQRPLFHALNRLHEAVPATWTHIPATAPEDDEPTPGELFRGAIVVGAIDKAETTAARIHDLLDNIPTDAPQGAADNRPVEPDVDDTDGGPDPHEMEDETAVPPGEFDAYNPGPIPADWDVGMTRHYVAAVKALDAYVAGHGSAKGFQASDITKMSVTGPARARQIIALWTKRGVVPR